MGNNTTLPGTGETIRDIDRTSYKTQVVGIDLNIGGGSEQLMTPGQTTMANSIPVVLPSNQSTIPVAAYEQSDSLAIGTTTYTVKRAKFAAGAGTTYTAVAAVTAKKIRVLALFIIPDGAVQVYFSNAADGAIFGDGTYPMSLTAGVPYKLDYNPAGWFQTGTNNEALTFNLSVATPVSGGIVYIEV